MLGKRQATIESWQGVSRTWSSGASSKLPPLRDWHEESLSNNGSREEFSANLLEDIKRVNKRRAESNLNVKLGECSCCVG